MSVPFIPIVPRCDSQNWVYCPYLKTSLSKLTVSSTITILTKNFHEIYGVSKKDSFWQSEMIGPKVLQKYFGIKFEVVVWDLRIELWLRISNIFNKCVLLTNINSSRLSKCSKYSKNNSNPIFISVACCTSWPFL